MGKGGVSCRTFEGGTPITGDQVIADSFCDSNVGSGMASKVRVLVSGSFADHLGPVFQGSMFMLPTNPREIESICLGLDPSSPGHDSISPLVVRYSASEISVPLSRLINVRGGALS